MKQKMKWKLKSMLKTQTSSQKYPHFRLLLRNQNVWQTEPMYSVWKHVFFTTVPSTPISSHLTCSASFLAQSLESQEAVIPASVARAWYSNVEPSQMTASCVSRWCPQALRSASWQHSHTYRRGDDVHVGPVLPSQPEAGLFFTSSLP